MAEDKKTFTNVAYTVDRPDSNGTIYPREVMAKALEEAQERIKNGQMFGTLDASEYPIDPGHASHQVVSMELDGDEVKTVIKILDTREGDILRELMENGIPKLSPVGWGNLDDDQTISDFSISAINIDTSNKPSE